MVKTTDAGVSTPAHAASLVRTVFVHAQRRCERAAAYDGNPRKLEQPLHRPILAVFAVQHGERRVQARALYAAVLRELHKRLCVKVLRNGRGHAPPGLPPPVGENVRAVAVIAEPVPVPCNPDKNGFVFFRVHVSDHRERRLQRNVVFA